MDLANQSSRRDRIRAGATRGIGGRNGTLRIPREKQRDAPRYTLAEAAKAVGMNKTSILRAIKSGRITGTRDEQRLADLKVMLEELHSDRDAWREQAQRLALIQREPKLTWWRWRSTG